MIGAPLRLVEDVALCRRGTQELLVMNATMDVLKVVALNLGTEAKQADR